MLLIRDKSVVYELTTSKSMSDCTCEPFLSVSPLLTRGIHVTNDNNIIVGVEEPGATYTPTDKSTRALLIFGMDSKQQQTYQYDSNKR
jgi:hypothetical protein